MASKIPFSFKIYSGDAQQREEQVTIAVPGVIKIGNLDSSHLRIEDEGVSRMHAVIEVSDAGTAEIMDLGSAHGTLLQGVKISKADLRDGSELTLGPVKVVVGIGAPIEEQAPAAAAPAASVVAPPPGISLGPSSQTGAGVSSAAVTSPVGVPAASAPGLGVGGAGASAIEVTTMFQDTVLGVRHLDNPAGGRSSPLTWGLLGIGWGIFAVGAGLAIAGQTGFGGLLLVIGLALGMYALIRRSEERRSPDFTLGGKVECDVHLVHAAVPAEHFPLVRSDGTAYSLLYTGAMSGDVTVGAERSDLGELASSGRVQAVGEYRQTYAYPIPDGARIKVDIGDNTFLISSVEPARRVVSPFLANVDWSVQISNGMSFAAHAMLLFLVFAVPPDAKALSLDLFDADNEFIKYLVKPPEQKQDEIPAWLKKAGPDKAGGKGKRHKFEEGKMGKKDSKKKRGLYGLKGPKDNPDPHLAKQLAENQAREAGVLGLLGSPQGSHLASIFGRDTALGTDAEDALGGLIGDQIGEAYGVGGLGLFGSGRGGGGTGEGTIGLGALGTIGKGGGGGDGAGYGRGAGTLGGRQARVPKVVAGRAEVRGSLDKEIIRRIIRRHINEVKFCYAKELQADESLGGRVVVQFTIAATGQVVVSKVQESSLGNRKVEQCIASAVRRWLFPKPKGGGIVIVSYPFVLRAAGT